MLLQALVIQKLILVAVVAARLTLFVVAADKQQQVVQKAAGRKVPGGEGVRVLRIAADQQEDVPPSGMVQVQLLG
jgi:hypothetical protein